jgi:regulator of protease activity HflC (stomatin/prohibitin superfamily)
MNAITPPPAPAQADRLLRGVTLATLAGVLGLILLANWPLPSPVFGAISHTRLVPLLLASLLLALAGLLGNDIMAWSRQRASQMPLPPPRGPWIKRAVRIRRGDAALIGRAARWPQAIFVTAFAVAAIACIWSPLIQGGVKLSAVSAEANFAAGAAVLVLAFPLLVMERLLAATPVAKLPEAPALRALMLVCLLVWPACALIRFGAGLGAPLMDRAELALGIGLSAVAVELCLRALARCFLPPPIAAEARAAVHSLLARMVAEGLQTRSFAAPVRTHLGIDFSRSWALAYLRAATPPVALVIIILGWGLTGVVIVRVDQRAIYERFGAPVAVLHAGLHTILPYPFGRAIHLEYGTLHETALSAVELPPPLLSVGAEDPPPPEADRLWEQAHPGELTFLIASPESFQVISADIKLRYRIGLSDQQALQAAYRVADPAPLLRGAAGALLGGFFAQHTLDAVLGDNREQIAADLRTQIQHAVDAMDAGIELSAVVIEAIHPPAGAATAYHAVQAAQIESMTSISAERGRALATQSSARQYGFDIVSRAHATSAEAVSTATADLTRFTADYSAAMADRDSFMLERRLSALTGALTKGAMTIIDHRIPEAEAPVIDLRPAGAANLPAAGPALE